MTRRKIIYVDGFDTYIAPEFNGDKEEYEKFGSADSCDKNWSEIEAEFLNVKTVKQFVAASERAQGYYHSSIAGQTVLPVKHVRGHIPAERRINEHVMISEW